MSMSRATRRFLVCSCILVALALMLDAVPRATAGEKVKIRYSTFFDHKDLKNARAQAEATILRTFMEKNPDVDVQVELVDWRTMESSLLRSAAAGEAPDVARIFSLYVAEQVAAGTFLPLDSYMKAWSPERSTDIIGVRDMAFGGRTYALYIDTRIWLNWLRSDLFEAAGLKPPQTLDEITAAAKLLTRDGMYGFAIPLGRMSSQGATFHWFNNAIRGQGGDLVNADKSAAFNGPAGVRVFQWLHDMVHVHKAVPPEILTLDEDAGLEAYRAGRLAMYTQGTNRSAAVRTGQFGKFMVSFLTPSADPAKPVPTFLSGYALGITKSSKHPEVAWKLIDHFTSRDSQLLNAKQGGETPMVKSAFTDPWFSESDNGKVMLNWRKWTADAQPPRVGQLVSILRLADLLNGAAQEIIGRKAPVKATLDQVAARWNAIAK